MNAARKKLEAGELVLCMGLRQARTVDVAMIAAARQDVEALRGLGKI